DLLLLLVDLRDPADVAVEYFALVVVLGLNHLVADAKRPAEPHDLRRAGRIEGGLQHRIEIAHAQLGAIHRRQHLHAIAGRGAEARRDAIANDGDDAIDDVWRIGGFDEIEVALPGRSRLGHLA